MFNVHVEIPCGAISRGYDYPGNHRRTPSREAGRALRFPAAEEAAITFHRLVAQIRSWGTYTADVVITEDGHEVRREQINA
jgi:hypothetical protein